MDEVVVKEASCIGLDWEKSNLDLDFIDASLYTWERDERTSGLCVLWMVRIFESSFSTLFSHLVIDPITEGLWQGEGDERNSGLCVLWIVEPCFSILFSQLDTDCIGESLW